ncbi:MAG: XisI protein [Symploca sp. SIO1B1]|nr:XisI protein [Symploca sp. SIO1B1]
MDKVAKYREYVQTLLNQYTEGDVSNDEVEVQLIFDTYRDHYQWMNVGWQQFHRIYRCIVHVDIKDGKIWLQQNLTDLNPAEDLVKMGVPPEDIVLGLQPPFKRQYTDYGVA